MAVFRGIDTVIDTAQRRPSSKDSCVEKLVQLCKGHGADCIWNGDDTKNIRGIRHFINILMNHKTLKEDAVARIIAVLVAVGNNEEISEGDKHPLFEKMFDGVVVYCEDVCPVRRLRASSFIVQLIRKLLREEWLSDEQFAKMEGLAPLLAIDKVPAIRCEGMRLLAKLQDPKDPGCVYMNKILFHMAKDPKAEVRRTCVEVIALCTRSLSKIQLRSMDVSASVRKQVYKVYAKRLRMKVLQLTDRTHILTRGLADRNPAVVQVIVEEVLPGWLEQCDNSLLCLLNNIDPYHKPETTVRIIHLILEKALKEDTLETLVSEFVEKHVPQGNDCMKEDKLTAPALMMWRELIVFMKKNSDDELCHALLFKVLPETGRLAHLMVRNVGKENSTLTAIEVVNHRLICTQLISLLCHADFSDFAGQSRLNEAVKTFLAQSRMEPFFEPLVDLLCTLHANDSEKVFCEVVDIISEIESPLMDAADQAEVLSRSMCAEDSVMEQPENEEESMKSTKSDEPLEVVQAKVQITLLREKISDYVENQKFMQAQKTKEELEVYQKIVDDFENQKKKAETNFLSTEAENDEEPSFEEGTNRKYCDDHFKDIEIDPASIRRCLALMAMVIRKATPRKMDSMLENFLEQRALKAICMPVSRVRIEAVRCISIGCILDKDFARSKIFILTHIAKSDIEEIRVIALRGIFDLLLRFGIKTFSTMEEEPSLLNVSIHFGDRDSDVEAALQKIISFLVDFLKLKDEKVLETVIEGLCKLMFVGQLVSPRILAHLLSFWFNSNYASNANIIHSLSLFFEIYPRMSRERMDVVREAFFPSVRLFFDANDHSALSTVSVDRVVDTLVSLCDIRCMPEYQSQDGSPSPHDQLAEELLNTIHKDPYSNEVKFYARALSRLTISANADHRLLLRLYRTLVGRLESISVRRQLTKFSESVKTLLQAKGMDMTSDTNENASSVEEVPSQGSDCEAETPLAHDIALRKRLKRTTRSSVLQVFSDSD